MVSDLMRAVLEKNVSFQFQAFGHSMAPFIQNNDMVTVSPFLSYRLKTGDIVAAYADRRGVMVIHRIIGVKKDGYILKGDNAKKRDGLFPQTELIGVVTQVARHDRAAWYGGGFWAKKMIAALSKSGLLGGIILPVLRLLISRNILYKKK